MKQRRRKPRLELELLENRIVPTTFTRVADLDGYATDANLDGDFESWDTTSTWLETTRMDGQAGQMERRSVLEFDVSSLAAGTQVTSARLEGYIAASYPGVG